MAVQSDYRYRLTVNGASQFEVVSFVVTEQLSDLFRAELELVSFDNAPHFSEILDHPATLTFLQADCAVRHLNGIVTHFEQGESGFSRTRYHMVIEPALSRAGLQSDVRIFQQQDSQQIIETLLGKNQVAQYQFHLTAPYWTREYCVQYRETDLAFIQRLAAEEGTYYYFEHTANSHILHFSNSTELAELKGRLHYNPMPSGERPQAAVWHWAYAAKLASTRQTLRDYTFTNPRYHQEHQSAHHQTSVLGEASLGQYEQYDYPGRYKRDAQGKPFSRYRLEYAQREAELVTARSDDLQVIPGYCFSLTGHPRGSFNGDWLVVGVVHRGWQYGVLEEEAGEEGNRYENECRLIPHGKQWRPTPHPKPRVDGPQMAHVVGPTGEEIYCDEWGRVKVQFPWDREGGNNEHSSCWIRVSQSWAGAQFGAMMIPRVGHEVIVSFLEGDPDQPIITGCTYHSTTEPPYRLPEHKTRMTIKSKSHKGDGFNELRFEDEKDKEEVFIHAQKDQNNVVNHNETTKVGRNRRENVGRNEKITVGKNRSQTIKQNELLTVGFNRMTNIAMNELHNVGMMRSLNVLLGQYTRVGQHYHLTVGQDYHLDVGNHTQVSTEQTLTMTSQQMHLTGQDEIRLESRGGQIHLNEKGITLKGVVTIEGPLTVKGDAIAGGRSVEGECIACKQAAAVGRPVNPILGIKLLTDEVDFALPGLLPLRWQRSYYSDVAHEGWLGQGWRVNGCQRIESRLTRLVADAEPEYAGTAAFMEGKPPAGQPIPPIEQLIYVDEQGREVPLPAMLEQGEPVYIQAEQLWVQRLATDTIRLSALDKTLHFTFMRQGEEEKPFVLTQITDNHGNRQQFLYGQDNLPYAIVDGNGRVFALQFANIASENQANIKASSQRRLTHVYLVTQPFSDLDLTLLQEILKKPTALSTATGTDSQETVPVGRPLVSYRYNADGDLIEVTDGLGNLVRKFGYRHHLMISHEDSAGLISTYEYDHETPNGKVMLNTTNLGERWAFSYFPGYTVVTDVLGRREEYHFDEHNELVKRISSDGQAMGFERDKLGRVLSQTNEAGQTTYFEYNRQGQITKLTRPDNAMLYFMYDNDGHLLGQTDAQGNLTRYRYDDNGKLIERVDALNQKSVYAYNDKGLLTSSTDPLGNKTLLAYDENFQLNQVTDCSGNQTGFQYNERGQLTSKTDALGNTTAYQYNDRQQLLAVMLPNQSRTTYTYDNAGRITAITDPQGQLTRYQYRIDGLPTVKTNAQGHHFHYHYDNAGRLVGLTNENRATYRFVYDDQDRLIWEKGFDDKLTQYEYDAKGQLVRRTDYGVTDAPKRNKPAIRTAEFKYNPLGQMTEAHIRQGEQSSRTTFSFDLNGQMTQVACTGQHIDFRYDATGRLIEECLNGQAIAYEYDANGNRLKTRLPSGDSLGYFYYGSGHLSGIKFNHQLITDIHRNALHQEICRSQGGLTTHYQYNPLGQLTHQQTELAHPQNTPQIDRTYGYDELGHLIQTRTHCPQQPFEAPQQTQYQYDNLGRIAKAASQGHSQHFYFDPASNLINDPTEKVINNRLSHYQGVRYTYDSLGNLTECQTANGDYQRYTYDLKNRLIQADIHNRYTTESWVYDYDPLGRRIAKSKLNKQGEKQCHTQFIWAGSHLVQEIRKGKNSAETDRTFTYIYTHPDSYEPLAQCYKEGDNAEHTVNYFHCDQIGVPREMTDSQGKLIWKGRYDAWGQLIHDSNRHAQRSTHQPFRLQNQYFDQETGLHYNFFRYYDPHIGRFTQQDPIGLMGGMNLYRFEGTVQNQVDPLGLFPLVLAAPWLLEALAHATAAMTGILIGVGIVEATEAMEATEESEETNDIGKCPNKPKCPDDVYNRLTENVNRAKAYSSSLGKCLITMTNSELQLRIDAANAERSARIEREDTCWDGGDSGHQQQITDIGKRINNCMRYMR